MNKTSVTPPASASPQLTRRTFVGRALATGALLTGGAPAFLRGQNLNNKLNIAFIGCGGRANTNLNELTLVPGRSTKKGKASGNAPAPESNVPHPDENVAPDVGHVLRRFSIDRS